MTPNSKKLSALTRLMLSCGPFLRGPPSFPGPEMSFERASGIVWAGLSSGRWLECQSNGEYHGVRKPRRRYFQMHITKSRISDAIIEPKGLGGDASGRGGRFLTGSGEP